MKRLQGVSGYLLIFACGILLGSVWAGKSADTFLRGVASAENQTANRLASSIQKVGESSGSGDGWTDPFTLREGRAGITVQSKGHGPLSFRLVEERTLLVGEEVGPTATLEGEFGMWKLVTQAPIDTPGRYLLRISGDGDWKVTVSQ